MVPSEVITWAIVEHILARVLQTYSSKRPAAEWFQEIMGLFSTS